MGDHPSEPLRGQDSRIYSTGLGINNVASPSYLIPGGRYLLVSDMSRNIVVRVREELSSGRVLYCVTYCDWGRGRGRNRLGGGGRARGEDMNGV